jgi:sterol 14alpha-demethylase
MALGAWLLLAAVAVYMFLRNRTVRKAEPGTTLPPFVRGSWVPFFGCIKDFALAPMDTVRRGAEELGDCFTLKIVGKHMTFLAGPEAHKAFFDAKDDVVSAKEAYRFVVPVFGRGVVYDSPTRIMYEQLKFVRDGFSISALRAAVPKITMQTEKYIQDWGESGTVEILDELNKVTILTASRCLLGAEINEDPTVALEFARLYHDLEQGLQPISFFFPYLPIPAHRRRDIARVEVSTLFKKVLAKRRAGNKASDMMQNLMDARYKPAKAGEEEFPLELTDDQIAGLLVGLLFAGQHTSGITSTWTLLFLCDNQDFMDKVLKEQQDLLLEFGGTIDSEVIRKSPYLEQCVRETLRMYPPLIHLMRKVMKPMKYKNFTIPVGDLVCISPGAAMRLESCYEDADTWNPDRMVKEDQQRFVKENRYIPFGGGYHGCPGEFFGIQQIKTILTVLLRKYEFALPGPVPGANYEAMVVGPKGPYNVRYKKREVPIDQLNLSQVKL